MQTVCSAPEVFLPASNFKNIGIAIENFDWYFKRGNCIQNHWSTLKGEGFSSIPPMGQ